MTGVQTCALPIFLSLGAVAYLGFQNMQLTKQVATLQANINKKAVVEVSPTPLATNDPTANWRDVTSKYWSLRTPLDLHYILCEPDEASFLLDPTLTTDQKIECNFDGVRLISIGRTTSSYPIPTNPPVIPTADPNSPVGEAANLYTLVSENKNIIIGGKNGIYQKEEQHGGQGSGVYYKAYVVDGSTTYIFSLSDISKKDLFDQILSTFKFN